MSSTEPPDTNPAAERATRPPLSPAASSTTLAHEHDDAHIAPPAIVPSDVRTAGEAEDEQVEELKGTKTAGGAGEPVEKEPAQGQDLEAAAHGKSAVVDIEHLEVADDPRKWSNARKNAVLAIISFTAIGGTITGSIFFPALEDLQADLNTTNNLLACGVSLFILGQGGFPMCWSAISEVSGRKYCYIVSLIIYIVGSIVCSRSQTIAVFLIMRILQSLGSSAVLSLGAGTLADMYDTHERGTKLGIFYACPLLGPAAGPIIGGGLTAADSWRGTFYFLAAYGGVCLALMFWLPDTFRKERSMAWRKAYERAKQHQKEELAKARAALPKPTEGEKGREGQSTSFAPDLPAPERALTRGESSGFAPLKKVKTALSAKSGDVKVRISMRDINPLAVSGDVIKQPTNFLVLLYSGFLFASQYCITFTASRTFAAAPYNYTAIEVGLVLLSFGLGNVLGSIGGGRYSDYILAKLKAKNGGKGEPEMRIKSTFPMLPFIPLFFIMYGWFAYFHLHIASVVVTLFFLGAAIMVVYATTLAYIVDANPGRSTSAVACNSLFRGVLACAASQAAEPILDHIKNGAFYSGWGILLLLGEASLVVISMYGQKWREASRAKEEAAAERKAARNEAKLDAVGAGSSEKV
ncbi:hypothetical protein JCM8097_008922 [Rhodosporidiobolus ruineniae]